MVYKSIVKNKRAFSVQENAKWMQHNIDDLLLGLIKYHATYYESSNDNNKDHYLYITKKKYREIVRKEYSLMRKISERTVDKHLKILVQAGLIEPFTLQMNKKTYPSYGIKQEAAPFIQIPNDWLKHLICVKNIHSVKIYFYLLNKYLWKKQTDEQYIFTNKELIKVIGMTETSDFASTLITEILEDLKISGILNFETFFVRTEDNKPSPRKRLLFVPMNREERELNLDTIYNRKREE